MTAARLGKVILAIVLLSTWAAPARGEAEIGHEVALGLTGVYDVGYDRGLHYGLGYEFSWSLLRASAMLALGDSDPRDEQQWELALGAEPWRGLRFDAAFRHRTFVDVGFGENLVLFKARLLWRGLELGMGYVLRFPILDRDEIHSPAVFDMALFDHFLIFRIGYIWQVGRGVGLGLLTSNYSRFELHSLDYPQFAAVLTFNHPRVGSFRLDAGIGIAGFFNMGSTIDRGFVRLEYVRASRRAGARRGDSSSDDDASEESREQE